MSLRRMGQLQPRPISRVLACHNTQITNRLLLTNAFSTQSSYSHDSKRNVNCPTNQEQCSPSQLRPKVTLCLQSHQQQIRRDFQTHSRCFVTPRDYRSDGLNTFSQSTDVIQPNNDILGERLGVISYPYTKDDDDVCKQLQNENFRDYRSVYSSKTAFELARSSFFFFLFKYKVFTDHAEEFMQLMNKVLGEKMSEAILKKLIYNQYVAGETNEEILNAVNRLRKEGIKPLIAVPIEDDIGTSQSQSHDGEKIYNKNCDKIHKCINLCMDVAGSSPMFQLRITALMSPQLIKTLSEACSINESGDNNAISKSAVQVLVQGIQDNGMEFPQTKEWDNVSAHKEELQKVLRRVRTITERILETDIVAMVDAECTYFNPAIRHLTFAMMEICNKKKPLVFYTYQAYLKNMFEYLKSDMSLAKSRGLCFGAKLVRGAYMVKERKRAESESYPDPVNDSYEETSKNYQRCLDQLMFAASENEDTIRFIIATHNEDSVRHAFKRMTSLGLSVDSKAILFGQLYGMADHVSFTLGKKGCNIVKSLPYGSVDDTVPYLSRRAQENRSIFDNVRAEKQMVRKALMDRILRRS